MSKTQYTYKRRNKEIVEVETRKVVVAKFNKHILYMEYCDCCGKYTSMIYRGRESLNSRSIWGPIHTALKYNKNKTIQITFPYLDENNNLHFK